MDMDRTTIVFPLATLHQ
ncbi:hypothetical protein FG05_35342 [Fusarium graminearum]|nr:hypothetical protein FG05_35342 [Fusarium graminearum]